MAEFVVCLPAFFLLVIVGIQFALWSHAATSHAPRPNRGVRSPRATARPRMPASRPPTGSSPPPGPGTLTHPQVSNTTLPGDVAQVTVTGRAQALIPWFDLDVSATSDAPIQEYRAEVTRVQDFRSPPGLEPERGRPI